MGVIDKVSHLNIHHLGHRFGVVPLVAHIASQEHFSTGLAQFHRSHGRAHAIFSHHSASDRRGLVDVVGGPRGGVVEDKLFSNPATHGIRELVEQLVAGYGVLITQGHHHRVPQGAASGKNGHFGHRVGVAHRCGCQRVSALVIRRDLPLFVAHHAGPSLRPRHHAIHGLIQRDIGDFLPIFAGGQEGSLV